MRWPSAYRSTYQNNRLIPERIDLDQPIRKLADRQVPCLGDVAKRTVELARPAHIDGPDSAVPEPAGELICRDPPWRRLALQANHERHDDT